MHELNILNLGCGNDTYGTVRVDFRPTETTTHVFDVERDIPWKFPAEYFDIVFSKNLLEHLRNVGRHLEECYRVLKKGGTLIVITDNAECGRYYLFGTHTGRYEKRHQDYPSDRHYCIFTENHLRNHLESAGFKIISTEYVKTDTSGRFIDMFTKQRPRIKVVATK
jgi:predicted SAM-dependent methyltransferase